MSRPRERRLGSCHGITVHRARGREQDRQGHEPRQGAVPGRGPHEARPRRLLPRGRRRDRPRAARAADAAPSLPRRDRGRADLPEARPREAAGVDRGRTCHVPLRPARRRAVRDRGGTGDLGREPRRHRLPPLALPAHRRRSARRAANRRRPAARDDVRRREAGRSGHSRGPRRDGVHRLAEDVRKPRHPHRGAHRAPLGVPRRPPLRARLRARDRAPRARPRHHRLVEGAAGREGLHRLQPERPRPDDRLRLLGASSAGRDRLRARDLGRAPRCRDRGLHARHHAERFEKLGDVQAAIDDTVCDLRVLLEWVEREEAEGVGEAPYPPNFPKMPGEPARVQPSRARKPQSG